MSSDPIGIIDSGFGGLSIYKSVQKVLPNETFIYIGDHAYIPYGQKSRQVIQNRVKKLTSFLMKRHIKLLVIACNTATIAGIDNYRRWFPAIPIIGVVPVVKTAGEISKKRSFAVLSTRYTAKSSYQKNLIKKFAASCHVYNLGCPNLVSFVEKGVLNGVKIDQELRTLLTKRILRSIDVIALGCTHYPFLQYAIRGIVGKNIRILDSGGAVSRHVRRILTNNDIRAKRKGKKDMFYTTGKNKNASMVASKLLHKIVHVSYANI